MQRVYLEYLGNLIELPPGETRVGRDLDCAIRLDDAGVSRHHLRVVRRGEEVLVEDLGSRNGTFVNGRAIAGPLVVRDRDVIVLSTRVLIVRTESTARAKRTTMGGSRETAVDESPRTTVPSIHTQPIAISRRVCPECGAKVAQLDEECPSCGESLRAETASPDAPTILRRHTRHPIAVELRYVSTELEIEVTSRDLSESGVFVCSQVLDPIGTECELILELAQGQLGARGVVRRVVEHGAETDHPVGLGVEFVDLGPAERAWLRDVIADPDHHLRRD